MQVDHTAEQEHIIEDRDMSCDQLSRRDQRALIFHILYAMEAFDYQVSPESIVDNFNRGFDCKIDPSKPVFQQATAIIADRAALDEEIRPMLDNWRFDRIGCCTKLILRMALWELMHTDAAPSVVINEAVELAKCFAELDAYKFVNGVLDEWARKKKSE